MRSIILVVALLMGCVPVLNSGEPADTGFSCPDNQWLPNQAPETLPSAETGFFPGQLLPDAQLVDQHGDDVRLWQFHGQIIVLDVSLVNCAPCQDLAEVAASHQAEYADQGVTLVTILAEENPTVDTLAAWDDRYQMGVPVLADPNQQYSDAVTPLDMFPRVLLIGRDLIVADQIQETFTDDNMRAHIDTMLESQPLPN